MPTFSRFFEPDVAPLLRLLADPSLYPTQSTTSEPTSRRAFSPNFDVHETESSFVLEGELPGLNDKSKVDIEFTDGNTLLVRGRIERSIHASSPSPSSDSSKKEEEHHASHKPTVEDAPDPDDNCTHHQQQQQVTKSDKSSGEVQKQNQHAGPRYWVSERSIGSFQRSFNFPGDIDHEKVTAKLKDGVLTIVVPKKVHPAPRKITIE